MINEQRALKLLPSFVLHCKYFGRLKNIGRFYLGPFLSEIKIVRIFFSRHADQVIQRERRLVRGWYLLLHCPTFEMLLCYFRSSGCRVLTRHLSVTDAVGKRREIVVPGKAKPKDKEKKKKEKPQSSISSRG